MKVDPNKLLLIADLAGPLLFGMEAAMAAIKGNLDLLGLMVLAFASALGGGIIRDLLLGQTPPSALREWRWGDCVRGGSDRFRTVLV
jgi:uncharacterized membrane protein YeiH